MSFNGKYILAAIDGTGSSEWRSASGFSHVHQFYQDFDVQGGTKTYKDGPGEEFGGQVFGRGSGEIIESVVRFINYHIFNILRINIQAIPASTSWRNHMRQLMQDRLRICLVGHSRGGLIAIHVAEKLAAPVYFMALYDAVDMHPSLDADVIVNVDTTYHALRNPIIGSRSAWSNCGLSSQGSYFQKTFMTSHGGIGGDPVLYPEGITSDYACSVDTLTARIEKALGHDRGARCQTEAFAANAWIRQGARSVGLRL